MESRSDMKLSIGAILPHVKVFGGVKRYLELGNLLIDRGHEYTIFTPEGAQPSWFDFKGTVVRVDNLSQYSLNAIFVSEAELVPLLDNAKSDIRIAYAILQRKKYVRKLLSRDVDVILANSTNLFRYLGGEKRKGLFKAIGGIDTQKFSFKNSNAYNGDRPFVVMAYGRFYKKKKGTMLVVRACEKLFKAGYNIKLHLFDSPTDTFGVEALKKFKCNVPHEFFINFPVKQLQDLYYQADVFVSAERNAGWSNTSAEAMACGVPVIATASGTEDFLIDGETGIKIWRHSWFIQRAIKKLYHRPELGVMLASNARKKIETFSWSALADRIEQIIYSNR